MNIAFVTREISGLTRNGGIGTAVRYLCEHLAHNGGHEVHVYYTGRPRLRLARHRKAMKPRGIALHSLPFFAQSITGDYAKKPRHLYAMLRSTRHDAYIFHEFMADGFFCLQAQKNGEAFAGAQLGVVTHGSSLWVDEGNNRAAAEARRLQLYDMEKSCCELADFLISPSSYLLDWMRGHAWALPDISRCIPNFVSSPGNGRPAMPRQHLAGPDIREIVFFGRLEERKGVRIFCDAIAMLPERLLSGRTITFLGKEDHFRADDLRSRLTPLLDKAGGTLLFFTGYDSVEAREYLCREGVLAVMPSLRENSPCTVSECLESGVPFIASSTGGGKELILEKDREAAIFIPQKECLAERLRAILESEGITAARPSWAVKDIFRDWQAILEDAARHRH